MLRILAVLGFLWLSCLSAFAGTITITIATTSPSQTLTKTFTDTDANVVLALTAMQNVYGGTNAATAALAWAQQVIANLVATTTNYQHAAAAATVINPQ